MRDAWEACSGVEVVVVDAERATGMAGVQGEGEGLGVLEGERLRVWAVSAQKDVPLSEGDFDIDCVVHCYGLLGWLGRDGVVGLWFISLRSIR